VISAPLIALYLALGWSSSSRLFKPAQLVKSVVNSKADRSTETRDVENYNLMVTLRSGMLLGTGYGHEYIEAVRGDDISKIFPEYRYVPHNSYLGLLAFGGLLGYSGIVFELAMGMFLASRAFRAPAASSDDRVAAFVSIAIVVIYLIQAYGDMGASSSIGIFLVAVALAYASKLVVAVGAWPGRIRSTAPAPPTAEVAS
jgi:hypothetical protein